MIGKIVKIGIVGLLAATLIGGSAYVVLRPNEAQAQQENVGRGQSGREYAAEPGGGKGYGAAENALDQGTGGGNGKGNSAATASGNGAGQERGQGNGQGAGSGKGSSGESGGSGEGYPATEWITVSGEVIARVDGELTIQTADGERVVHLGPEWYWEAEGIALEAGDSAEVTGFYEGDEFEVARVGNTTTGESVTLRDDSGRPMWAGRGRQGN
jgi:hypothetical protein